MTFDKINQVLKDKKYTVFTTGDYNLNILFVKDINSIVLLYKVSNKWTVKDYRVRDIFDKEPFGQHRRFFELKGDKFEIIKNKTQVTSDKFDSSPMYVGFLGIVKESAKRFGNFFTLTVVDSIDPPKVQTSTTNMVNTGAKITWADMVRVAGEYGVEPCAVQAIYEVESAGDGFLKDGRPKILFEGHILWRQLRSRGIDPARFVKGNEDVLYSTWTKAHYKGGAAEYNRLEKAKRIHEDAALESASWGSFQIMGFHWKALGFPSVAEFVRFNHMGEVGQLELVMRFCKANNIIPNLKNKKWAAVAKAYNGSGYAQNQYDVKLEKAYLRCQLQKR